MGRMRRGAGATLLGWGLIVAAFVVLMAVGTTREPAPRTAGDRVDAISQRIACPTCDGESVYESRAAASENIRAEITAQVIDGGRTDDEIIEFLADRFGGQVLLVPRATGLEALAWSVPVAVAIVALTGLMLAFRRWSGAVAAEPTEADRELVERALEQQARSDGSPGAGDAGGPP